MRQILYIIVAVGTMAAMVACGSKSSKDAPAADNTVEEQNTQLANALNGGNLKQASAMADSMSLFVDDFTPEQTVQVLMTFLRVHNDAVENKDRRRDLETIRKYIDVYDIALSVNPKDTRAALDKARKINPEVDFDAIAIEFRERLTQYDAIQDGSLVAAEPEPTDSAAVDSVKEEIPLELRPAE